MIEIIGAVILGILFLNERRLTRIETKVDFLYEKNGGKE